MYRIEGCIKENPFDLDGFGTTNEAVAKIVQIAIDSYGVFGLSVKVLEEFDGESMSGTIDLNYGDSGYEDRWKMTEYEDPIMSESVANMLREVFNLPEYFTWHGDDDRVPAAVATTEVSELESTHVGYRGAWGVGSRPLAEAVSADHSGERPRWVEVPGTAHSEGENIRNESNFHTLVRDFGHLGVFVVISYGSRNGGDRLAIPLGAEIPDELARAVAMLDHEDPVWDDSDVSERESEARDEDWNHFGRDDFIREIEREVEKRVDFDERDDFALDHIDEDEVDRFVRDEHPNDFTEYEPGTPGGNCWDLSHLVDEFADKVVESL
ncbi:hypothetical protein GS982_01480 [Rhodococcus hoagii]|uniref:Uncharacterized protein n=1 Tax=Rhodococcus hoagii TaxID=43767 RepID=A0A9Q4ZII4_RHOHA|nr:hypothetical protein [Prescottella equi]NKT77269.1 hypothetical protein [Prescottella equi]NKZ81055.1 hypothetical protein [Prescottella equi]